MDKRKIMNTRMTLMDADVTMLERKFNKLEKKKVVVEKEKLNLTHINLLNKQIHQLQEDNESSKLAKVVEEREEELKAKGIKLTMKNGQIEALELEIYSLKASLNKK